MIQDQIKLPLRVAVGVVMQGIRIRFGRSLVTIMGVVLGIAFLMSTLAGQVIKDAVQGEDQMRAEVKRMASFLAAEMGPPLNRTIGVIQTGPLNDAEVRLIRQLIEGGLQRLQWTQMSSENPVPVFSGIDLEMVALDAVARDASSVLLVGSGTLPEALAEPSRLAQLFAGASEKVLALTRAEARVNAVPGVSLVALASELPPEEIFKIDEARRNASFRANWIALISLVVTVAGIANAMLMSVTERFREIGTMKCLGALSSFIRWVFFVESGLMGAVGGAAGACLGTISSIVVYGSIYGFVAVVVSMDFVRLIEYLLFSVLAGVALSIVAAIYPASVASSMVPAHALRTNV